MIIDVHTHAWPEKIADKARETLETAFKVKFVGSPTLKTLLEFMDKNNIDISVICSVASRPEQVRSINDWLFSIRSKRIKIFCALHPDDEKWSEELERIKKFGDGVKMQPEFQNFYIDEEKALGIYEKMQDLKIPVLFHCGKELSGTKLIRSGPDRMLNLLNKFPHLKIIAAHFGGFQLWDEVERTILGKNIYLDTAFFFDHLPIDKIKHYLSHHPSDKLLFGTDFPLIDQKKDLDFIKRLKLTDKALEELLSLNASRLLGL